MKPLLMFILLVLSGASQAQTLSAAEAATMARQQTGGKVLKVAREGQRYHIKVLMPKGQVRHITIDRQPNKAH